MAWPCFWVTDTGQAELSLRRFRFSERDEEAGTHYHDASVSLGRGPQRRNAAGYLTTVPTAEHAHDDRWPRACACGYEFVDDDEWQVNQEAVYAGDGREWPQRELPAGAVFDAWWAPEAWKGPDGRAITVVLPDQRPHEEGYRYDARSHFWNVDGAATPADGTMVLHAWTRHGNPDGLSSFSVTPSIDATAGSGYHGFLTAGVLT